MRNIWISILALLAAGLAACSGTCPEIDCQPQVRLTYRQPITVAYHVAVLVRGASYEADCPKAPLERTTGIKSCGGEGIVVSGVDLGHGANGTVELAVTIDNSPPLAVKATLDRIVNSRECTVVCYDHSGMVEN